MIELEDSQSLCLFCVVRYYRTPSGTNGWTTAGSTAPARQFLSFGTGIEDVIFPVLPDSVRYYRVVNGRYYRAPPAVYMFWYWIFGVPFSQHYRLPSGTTGCPTPGSTACSRNFTRFGTGLWGLHFPSTTGPAR